MKKKVWIILAAVAVLAVLFLPIPGERYDDGGTREYVALTYKIVDWNRITTEGTYEATRIYWFADKDLPVEELWQREQVPARFYATVVEVTDQSLVVEPMEWEWEHNSASQIRIFREGLEPIDVEKWSVVEVCYEGAIRETFPASIDAVSWRRVEDLRHLDYPGQWLEEPVPYSGHPDYLTYGTVTQIYGDRIQVRSAIMVKYEISFIAAPPEDLCVGDNVTVTWKDAVWDPETGRVEATALTVEMADVAVDMKPVIYLYPEQTQAVTVGLEYFGRLTCTYPKYEDGWSVTASPDGTLVDQEGQVYNYLYWEGESFDRYDMSRGFCVRGVDTAAFLEEALEQLGLTRREANEFMVYWLPQMEGNAYNVICFQGDAYTDMAKLTVEPAPDTVIRVFMAWRPSQVFVDIPAQALTAPERTGFTVVEWGGAVGET